MAENAQYVPQGNHRRPFQVPAKGIEPSRSSQQRNPGGGADGQQATARARRQSDELPLA